MSFIRNDLKLGARFSEDDIKHAIGLMNVNAVCLQFPKMIGAPCTEVGKGCYPIFAIMSHHCICNARYFVDPATFNMFVRARVAIKAGEEITVQYLSALKGTHRYKISTLQIFMILFHFHLADVAGKSARNGILTAVAAGAVTQVSAELTSAE